MERERGNLKGEWVLHYEDLVLGFPIITFIMNIEVIQPNLNQFFGYFGLLPLDLSKQHNSLNFWLSRLASSQQIIVTVCHCSNHYISQLLSYVAFEYSASNFNLNLPLAVTQSLRLDSELEVATGTGSASES